MKKRQKLKIITFFAGFWFLVVSFWVGVLFFFIVWHAAEILSVFRIILTWLCDNFGTQYAHALHK